MKGDFLGFTFNGKSNEDFNIVRTSDGDRYSENLQPEIKDITAEVPGMHGEYYFGSTYGNREFNISFAFDSLDEQKFREMRKHFGKGQIGELIFDERPYKKYLAKISSPIELSYVCFDEDEYENVDHNAETDGYILGSVDHKVYTGNKKRIYKGDGTINFVCYFPFAKSTFKVLPESTDTYYEGSEDWAVSSRILSEAAKTEAKIDLYDSENNQIKIYNAGDVTTGFRLYVPATTAVNGLGLNYTIEEKSLGTLVLNPVTMKSINETEDIGILIDTNTGLISGIQPQTTTNTTLVLNPGTGAIEVCGVEEQQVGITYDINGNAVYYTNSNIYNSYIASGYLFKLEPNATASEATITFTNGAEGIEIFYDYLYF